MIRELSSFAAVLVALYCAPPPARAQPATVEIAFVANSQDATIALLDVATRSIVGRIDVNPGHVKASGPGAPNYAQDTDVSPDGKTLYVSRAYMGDVAAFDLATGKFLWNCPLNTGRADHMTITRDGRSLFVSAMLDNRVYRIETATGKITGHFVAGVYPHDNKISRDGKLLYNTSIGAIASLPRPANAAPLTEVPGAQFQMTVVDVNTLDVRQRTTTDVAIRPWQFTPDEKGLYAQLANQHAVASYDLSTHTFTKRLELPIKPGITVADYDFDAPHHGLALTEDGQTLCLAGRASDYVALVSAPELKLLATIPVGDAPGWAETADNGNLCLVTNTRSDDLSIISIPERKELLRLPIGDGPKHITVARIPRSVISSVKDSAAAPLMTVRIKPGVMSEAVGKGDLDVTMTIPGMDIAAGAPFLSMGMFVPGLARPQVLGALDVRDASGIVPLSTGNERSGPGKWVATRAVKGDVVVTYRLIAENIPAIAGGPPVGVRIDGDGISATGMGMLMAPGVTQPYRIALTWDLTAMGPGAQAVSSFGDGDITLPAGPVSRLGNALYMAGHLKREPRAASGAFSAVWVGEPPFDPRPAMRWTATLHASMSRFFKDDSEPPYRVFLRYNPMNAGGGAALTHSFIVTYGTGVTGESLKSILGHEMTHTWTANGIGQWYSEGNAVFYQALLPWRAGLMTTDEYLADLNKTASRYYTNALKDTPEAEVAPRFWEDTRIRVLPYDRGAMYFAVLNGKIRKASGGKRSLDDVIQAMIVKVRTGQPVSEAVWLDVLRAEIGEDGPAVHRAMMSGGLMLPESGDFGPCFRRTTKPIRQFDLGFDNKSILGAEKIIQGLKPGSEAERAGLRNGDRITYAVALDAVQGDVTRLLNLQVTRDGKTFPLSYLPRGAAVDAYQWERNPATPANACKL